MPILSNPKHERFAQEIATGTSQQQAYVIAGYKAHASNPSLLAKDKRILARVAEIHSETAEQHRQATQKAVEALSIDKQWVLARLVENATKAAANEDFAPSNRALELIGKELVMFVDRTESVNINHDVSDKPLSEEQWAEQHATAH